MTKIIYAILALGIFSLLSCGNTDSPATAEVETSSISQSGNNPSITVANDLETKPDNLKVVEKELIPETGEVVVQGKVSPTLAESIKNQKISSNKSPGSSKVSQKIAKPKTAKSAKSVNTSTDKTISSEEKNVEPENTGLLKTETSVTPIAVEKPEIAEKPATFSHEIFDQLLKKYVSANGKVNYSGFKSEESKLNDYLKILDENPPASDWSKNKKMAYWINAYNAGTIKLILKNYPVSSITDLHGGKPWDQKWIPLGGKNYSLNNIENDILRPVYKDARIHFAVNCAAKSCPPLLNSAWTEDNLSQNLDKQARSFINDSNQNKITENAVEISKIFEWYAADFGNIIDYLNKYATIKIKPGAKITYKEYNWDLNN